MEDERRYTDSSSVIGNFDSNLIEIKIALTGMGKADKSQVQFMVKTIIGLEKTPRPDDAADALAVAICHSQTNQAMRGL